MTAIYIRTIDKDNERHKEGRWSLPEKIDLQEMIHRLENYAVERGYKDIVFFVDNEYNGSGVFNPADILIYREIKAGNIDTVIIDDINQIEGGMNILMMAEDHFKANNVRFVIAKYDEEAGKIIKDNYETWVYEEIDNTLKNMDKSEKGMSAKKVFKNLKKEMKIRNRKKHKDLKNAKKQEPKSTKAGNKIIDANEALWILKTKHNELKFK